MNFSDLGLAEPVMRAVAETGYETPTPIQAQAIPVVIAGGDLLGVAQTGTGKTAAFALPVLHRLLTSGRRATDSQAHGSGESRPRTRDNRKIRVLVLSPTRELAVQIDQSFATYGRGTGLRHVVVFGGVSQYHQVKALRAGIDILVATPGRLLDLCEQGFIDLSHVEVLVLDEADRMLDMGFLPSVRRIVADVPTKRQTLFFSATMPDEVRQLADSMLCNPTQIEITPVATTAERVEQSVCFVEKTNKLRLLRHLLKQEGVTRSLVFTRTKHGADKVATVLSASGFEVDAIHANRSQSQRQRALANFKCGRTTVLVATDIASRGIDVDGISHVFNFDLPMEVDNYVHRIGRTARAGASGVAISFCSGEERGRLRAIERLIRQPLEVRNEGQFASTEPGRGTSDTSRSEPVRRSSAENPQTERTTSTSTVKPRRQSTVPTTESVHFPRKPNRAKRSRPGFEPEFSGPPKQVSGTPSRFSGEANRGSKRPRRFGKPSRYTPGR